MIVEIWYLVLPVWYDTLLSLESLWEGKMY